MPQCVTGITNHISNMDTTSNRLGTRLVTTMTMPIPPHYVIVIPVAPSSHSLHSNNITIGLIQVIENPLLCIKQPHLCVIDTVCRFYERHQSKCIILAVNVSDEELRINKGITICFTHVVDVTEIHHGTELTESVNETNYIGTEINEPAINVSLPKETLTLIPLNATFMFHRPLPQA